MKKLVSYFIILIAIIGHQIYSQNAILIENNKLTVPNLGGDNFTLGINAELRVSTPITANGTVNLTSDSAWLILDDVLPSEAIASHLNH